MPCGRGGYGGRLGAPAGTAADSQPGHCAGGGACPRRAAPSLRSAGPAGKPHPLAPSGPSGAGRAPGGRLARMPGACPGRLRFGLAGGGSAGGLRVGSACSTSGNQGAGVARGLGRATAPGDAARPSDRSVAAGVCPPGRLDGASAALACGAAGWTGVSRAGASLDQPIAVAVFGYGPGCERPIGGPAGSPARPRGARRSCAAPAFGLAGDRTGDNSGGYCDGRLRDRRQPAPGASHRPASGSDRHAAGASNRACRAARESAPDACPGPVARSERAARAGPFARACAAGDPQPGCAAGGARCVVVRASGRDGAGARIGGNTEPGEAGGRALRRGQASGDGRSEAGLRTRRLPWARVAGAGGASETFPRCIGRSAGAASARLARPRDPGCGRDGGAAGIPVAGGLDRGRGRACEPVRSQAVRRLGFGRAAFHSGGSARALGGEGVPWRSGGSQRASCFTVRGEAFVRLRNEAARAG